MKLQKVMILFVAACLTASLAGCTKKDPVAAESIAPSVAATAEATAVPTPEPAKKHTISFFNFSYATIPPADGKGLQMINEKFNVDFKPEIVASDVYDTKLPIMISTNEIPDITVINSIDENFNTWSKQGAFLNLDEYLKTNSTFTDVPQYVLDQLKVDGHIYAIPRYFPLKYGKNPVIRQDWLDKLKLPMPTSFAELEKVAEAFTTQDPDDNGKADTYGIGLASTAGGILPSYDFGPYWSSGWYQTNEKGQLIPGIISKYNKEHMQFFANVYKAKSVDPDWGLKKTSDARKEFYASKVGIYWEQPYDFPAKYTKGLYELTPTAKMVDIPPFKAPDGSQGFVGGPGYYQMFVLSAKLKDDPDKVKRILEMLDFFRKFTPAEERNAKNADFDWKHGLENQGYTVVNGAIIDKIGEGVQPGDYFESREWAPNDESLSISTYASNPVQKGYFESAEDILSKSKTYIDPAPRVNSAIFLAKDYELGTMAKDELTRMITKNTVEADWDKFVQLYLSKGGQEVIDDVNKLLKDTGIKGEWK
jgi:putative aldouronate transport system substrate-binding protein